MTIAKTKRNVSMRQTKPWSVAEAKAHFRELLEVAKSQGPQTITRHGKLAAVVVSAEEWNWRTEQREKSLVEFLAQSPLAGSEVNVERRVDPEYKD